MRAHNPDRLHIVPLNMRILICLFCALILFSCRSRKELVKADIPTGQENATAPPPQLRFLFFSVESVYGQMEVTLDSSKTVVGVMKSHGHQHYDDWYLCAAYQEDTDTVYFRNPVKKELEIPSENGSPEKATFEVDSASFVIRLTDRTYRALRMYQPLSGDKKVMVWQQQFD